MVRFASGFRVKKREDQLRALGGDWSDVIAEPAFQVCNNEQEVSEMWGNIPKPTHEDDWLAQYNEPGQDYEQWKKLYRRMRQKQLAKNKGIQGNTIYLIDLSDPTSQRDGILHWLLPILEEYTRAFYDGVTVKTMSPLILTTHANKSKSRKKGAADKCTVSFQPSEDENWEWDLVTRVAHEYDLHRKRPSERQLQVGPLLDVLSYIRPSDAICLVAVTMEDLYDGKTDSFVSGMAAGGSQVALFSFLRYSPLHHDIPISAEELKGLGLPSSTLKRKMTSSLSDRVLTRRACKTLVHEIGHLYAIDHCIYHQCCMNGSGHLPEDFAQPMFLCPIELRKISFLLWPSVSLSQISSLLYNRYQKLLKFSVAHQWNGDTTWLTRRAQWDDSIQVVDDSLMATESEEVVDLCSDSEIEIASEQSEPDSSGEEYSDEEFELSE